MTGWPAFRYGAQVSGCVALTLSAITCSVGAAAAQPTPSPIPPALAQAASAAQQATSMLRPDVATSVVADLRVDANRDGIVDRRAAAVSDDTALKKVATASQGALMMPNLDDDSRRCPMIKTLPVESSATPNLTPYLSCGDAADEIVNGAKDEEDLAMVAALPMPQLGTSATATLSVTAGASKVRVFVKHPTGWKVLPAAGSLPIEAIRKGLELGIEAKEMLTPRGWDGVARLRLIVVDGTTSSTDDVALRVTPGMLAHHLQAPEKLWYPKTLPPAIDPGRDALGAAIKKALDTSGAKTPAVPLPTYDERYLQDIAEPLTLTLPRGTGVTTLRVLPVSVKTTQRYEAVFNTWRGPDVVSILPTFTRDNLNYVGGGNIEVIPPYTSTSGTSWPHGRLLMGRIDMDGTVEDPDPALVRLMEVQGLQGPAFFVNTSWLMVGHIDEVVSFAPADTPRGWKLLIADPRAADTLARTAQKAGVKSFAPAPKNKPTMAQFFSPFVRKHVQMGIDQVDRIEKALVKEIGLQPHEIVRIPVAYTAGRDSSDTEALLYDHIPTRPGMVRLTAALPNAINAQHAGNRHVVVAGQFGPKVKGRDLFMDAVTKAYRTAGLTPLVVDDRVAAWAGDGDVHCAANVWRRPTRWWTIR